MVTQLMKLSDPLSKDDSERTIDTKNSKKQEKAKTLRTVFFNTLNHRKNLYHCVFPNCSKSFPSYFRWKIHHIIHVIN